MNILASDGEQLVVRPQRQEQLYQEWCRKSENMKRRMKHQELQAAEVGEKCTK